MLDTSLFLKMLRVILRGGPLGRSKFEFEQDLPSLYWPAR